MTKGKAPDDENENTLASIDRISALPDSILGVILSFLPTKNAVATSTLSKTWKFLWRTVPTLDFCNDRRLFTKEQIEDENEKFIGFVNSVLLHHVGELNMFHLEWRHNFIQSHATSWVNKAIARNVHELSLTLGSGYHCADPLYIQPTTIFRCDSLRSLHLKGRFCLCASIEFRLPRLENLDLDGITFESDESFEEMIRGCPVLNYLRVRLRLSRDDFSFVISSTSLRRLELDLGYRKYLTLETSSLEHLKLFGLNVSVIFLQKKLTSLVEGDFRIHWLTDHFSLAGIYDAVVDVVNVLDCAKILTLSSDVMEVLSCGTTRSSLAEFKSLVILKASINCCYWSSLQDFIQRSNNLETLIINKFHKDPHDGNVDHDHSNWTTPIEVPRCLSSSLKKIVLIGYYGYKDEREMIRYMLENGNSLEVMEISCHGYDRRKIEVVQEICEFPRKSPACEMKLSRWE